MKDPESLGLRGIALQVARDLMKEFPDSLIVSGRRTVADQARAMAENEWKSPGFVVATYADSAPKRALVRWLGSKKVLKPAQREMENAFLTLLMRFSDDELSHLSMHLSGDAFDVQPTFGDEKRVAWLEERARKVGGKVILKEGGLIRRHFQAPRRTLH